MTSNSFAPQKLYVMQLQTSKVPVAGGFTDMVLGCYLVDTGDGKHILIDSGLPSDAQLPLEIPTAEHEKKAPD
jgi:N-acyl homoserine lactone hydrolase